RQQAVLRLLGRNVSRVDQRQEQRCLEALEAAEDAEFGALVADDEERKALIALVAVMTSIEGGGSPWPYRTTADFKNVLRKIRDEGTHPDPFARFLRIGYKVAHEGMAWNVGGGTWTQLREDLFTAARRLEAGETSLFPAYRELQRELSIDRADP